MNGNAVGQAAVKIAMSKTALRFFEAFQGNRRKRDGNHKRSRAASRQAAGSPTGSRCVNTVGTWNRAADQSYKYCDDGIQAVEAGKKHKPDAEDDAR